MTRALGAAAALLLAAGAAAAPSPDEDYVIHCSGCHRSDGAGTPGVVPSLRGLAPFLASAAGRAYLVRVPGVAQAALDDARLAALLGWVLDEFSGAAASPAYSAAEVRTLRARPLRDPGAARQRALGDAAR